MYSLWLKTSFTEEWEIWLIVLYFTNAWISETNEMWEVILCFITSWNSEANDSVSMRLMLIDYEFHTTLTHKTIIEISFTSLTITSRFDRKTYSLKQTSNILIWINEDLIPSTAFSTSFWTSKRRVRIFQDISETDNSNLNCFSRWLFVVKKQTNLSII